MKKVKWLIVAALVLCMLGGAYDITKAAETDTLPAVQQTVLAPSGIHMTKSGNMYLVDRSYHVLRKQNTAGEFSVIAGKEGKSGYKDGSAKNARFRSPWDVAAYNNGLAISDTENHVIRFYKDGKVSTIAGSGKSGNKNAVAKKASFDRPTGLAAGPNGELYIADTGNHVIRVMDKKGNVTVYAGSKKGCADGKTKNAKFCEPTGLCYYKGVLYVADSGNHRICKIVNGKVTTVAGSRKGIEGDSTGSALKARFSNPQEIYWNKDVMYISDTGNGSVKKLQKGKIVKVVEAYSLDSGASPVEPCALTVKGKYLFIGDIFSEQLLKIRQ